MNSVQNLITNNSIKAKNLLQNVLKPRSDQDFIAMMESLLNPDKTQGDNIFFGEQKKNSNTSNALEAEEDKMIIGLPEMFFNFPKAEQITLSEPVPTHEMVISRENTTGIFRSSNEMYLENFSSLLIDSEGFTECYSDNQTILPNTSNQNNQWILDDEGEPLVSQRGEESINETRKNSQDGSKVPGIGMNNLKTVPVMLDVNQEGIQMILPKSKEFLEKQAQNIMANDGSFNQNVQGVLGDEERSLVSQRGEENTDEPWQNSQYGSKVLGKEINNQKTVTVKYDINQDGIQKILPRSTEFLEKQTQDIMGIDDSFSHRNDKSFDENISEFAVRQDSLLRGDMQEKVRVAEIPTRIHAVLKEEVDDKSSRTLELKLDPEHLGDLKVRINWSNGKLSAQFYTQSDEAAKTLESEMGILKQNLTNMSINVEGLSVSIFGQGQGGFGTKSQHLPQYKRNKTKLYDVDSVERLEQKQSNSFFGKTSVNYLV